MMSFLQEMEPTRIKYEASANAIMQTAQALVIDSPEMAEICADELTTVKAILKTIEDERVKMKAPVLEQSKVIDDFFKRAAVPYLNVESKLKSSLLDFQREEARKAEEARRAAIEAARKQREEEERLAREKADEARKAQEAANKAEEEGDDEKADDLQTKAIQLAQESAVLTESAEMSAHAAPVVVETTKLSGISTRKIWKAECEDLAALVAAIAKGQAPIALVQFNQSEANSRAKALEKEFSAPGVRTYYEESMSARAKVGK